MAEQRTSHEERREALNGLAVQTRTMVGAEAQVRADELSAAVRSGTPGAPVTADDAIQSLGEA
jgi:hypothetical protein